MSDAKRPPGSGDSAAAKPWYSEGLRFSCLKCGDCCRGEPGFVWITSKEIADAAAYMKMTVAEFRRRYVRKAHNRFSLIELADGDCIFWEEQGCRIYPFRPSQCRTFPFWSEYLRSASAWTHAAKRCPGVDTGKLHTLEEIRAKMKER